MLRFHILTLFPDMFRGPFDVSILKRAESNGLIELKFYNLRTFTQDRHHIVDDYPYGGGDGMLMKPEPFFDAMNTVKKEITKEKGQVDIESVPVILLSPQGQLFTQEMARRLAKQEDIVLLCGHYEGIDDRVAQHLATDEVSIGDYVLTGGELPAMVLMDGIARLVPGVLGSASALDEESHESGLLEYPQYTRPPNYHGWSVPEILLNGDHARIARWQREQSLFRTWQRRPELLKWEELTKADRAFLSNICEDEGSKKDPP
jgi:tRNA (guanine37-N1)-methyltransferase